MKNSILLFMVAILSLSLTSCKQTTETTEAETTETTETVAAEVDATQLETVKAYYFHATRRCATCKAVETVSIEALNELYNGKVVFESINREEDSENPLLEKYQINGQTLLFVNGDKSLDLTSDAFLYARNKPEMLKEKIEEGIASIL